MDFITVTDLVNYVFCPRRAWIGAQSDDVDHEHRVIGKITHRVVDGTQRMEVRHDGLGIVGVPDVVRAADDSVEIIEYKATPGRRVPVVTDEILVQLTAYRACLEYMGTVVTGQSVWFTDHRRMVHVDSADLVPEKLAAIVSEARDAVTGSVSPPVLEDDSRCRGCSQVQVCLPSEELASSPKIVPRHTDGVPLYVHEQGGYVFWKRGRVYVRKRNGSEESFPVETIDHLAIVGDVSITTAVLRELPARGKPVLMCTYGGRCISYVSAMERPNGLARVRLATLSENIRYRIASELVRAKVGNQATVLARNQDGRSVAKRIREIRDSIRPELNNLPPDTDPAGYLFSVEGGCADLYFPTYRRSVSAPGDPDSWKRGDKRTNPDELNSALNFGYALLRAAVSRSILGCGLDPVDGTLHTPSRNKPALTLDIMEQFRAPLIDAVIRSGFNRRELSEKDFISLGGSSRLTESGRRTVVSLFGDALLRENTYLGRAMTWRRTLDYQARALVKVCDGTMPVYRGVHTR